MKKLLTAATVLALAGCRSAWNRIKAGSSRIVSRSVSGTGHGIGKAGAVLERSGEQVDKRAPAQSTNNTVQQPY